VRNIDSADDRIFLLRCSCDNCCLRPHRYFTIRDIWHTFGFDWDTKTNTGILPTLNLMVLEKLAIGIALKETKFNQKAAAEKLGISPRMVNWLMKRYHITSRKYRTNVPQDDEPSTEELFAQGVNLFEWANGRIVLCESEEIEE